MPADIQKWITDLLGSDMWTRMIADGIWTPSDTLERIVHDIAVRQWHDRLPASWAEITATVEAQTRK